MPVNSTQWLPAILAFVAVALTVLAMGLLWEWLREQRRHRELRRRLDPDKPTVAPGGNPTLLRQLDRESGWLDPLAERLPQLHDIQTLIDQANVNMHVGTFAIVTIGAAVGAGLVAMMVTNFPPVGIGAALVAATIPYLRLRYKKRKRMMAFLEKFPDAIDLLGRSIRAGHAFSTGLQLVAEETREPVAGEFRRVFEEQKFGLPLDETLFGLSERVDLVDVQIFVTAVLIQREVGGNLAEILDTLADTIRERFTIERQVRVYTAQGRLTGYLLAFLPVVLAFVIYVFNAQYLSILVEEQIGRVLIGMAVVMQMIGFLLIRKIVDIKV